MAKPISDKQKEFFVKHGWKTEGVTCGVAFMKMEEFFLRMNRDREIQRHLEEVSYKAHLRYLEKKKLKGT